jgi:5'-nucleotidase
MIRATLFSWLRVSDRMILLLTNDDGIHADGLAALEAAVSDMGAELWIVAPQVENSQVGHRVTTHDTLRFEQIGERRFALAGTPADCVRVALRHLMPVPPDWVFSGINQGGNLGRHDFVISGTIAAVREARFLGIPGVALSHYLHSGRSVDWSIAARRAALAIKFVMQEPLGEGEFWCVNLPHPPLRAVEPSLVVCPQEPLALEVRYEQIGQGALRYAGKYGDRARRSGHDVSICFGGDITLSRVSI